MNEISPHLPPSNSFILWLLHAAKKKSIKMLVGHLGLSQGAHAGDSTLPVELRPSGALSLCMSFGS